MDRLARALGAADTDHFGHDAGKLLPEYRTVSCFCLTQWRSGASGIRRRRLECHRPRRGCRENRAPDCRRCRPGWRGGPPSPCPFRVYLRLKSATSITPLRSLASASLAMILFILSPISLSPSPPPCRQICCPSARREWHLFARRVCPKVFHEQQHEHVIFVLRSVDAAAQLVAARPEGRVKFRFFDGRVGYLRAPSDFD